MPNDQAQLLRELAADAHRAVDRPETWSRERLEAAVTAAADAATLHFADANRRVRVAYLSGACGGPIRDERLIEDALKVSPVLEHDIRIRTR